MIKTITMTACAALALIAAPASAGGYNGVGSNGLTGNSLTSNALTVNALNVNAITSNSLTSNSLTTNSLTSNSAAGAAVRSQPAPHGDARPLVTFSVGAVTLAGGEHVTLAK